MRAIVLALAGVVAATGAASERGLLPSPPPFAEVLTEEGTGGLPAAAGFASPQGVRVPSSVATPRRRSGQASGNGGGLGRRPSPPSPNPATQTRFFFAGNGTLRLSHAYFETVLDVRYRRADGSYDPDALRQIQHFFRSREDGREGTVSLRLVELLAYVEDRFHPRQMTLLSGYRSPEFNEDLRAAGGQAARTSLHTQGLAADVALSGVDLKRVWRELRTLRTGGAGYYRKGNFLHLDTGPPRFWEETTSRVGENLSAGNARIFVRTDFDRYPTIDGAELSLYSVTAFPLLIAAQAQVAGPRGGSRLTLEPIGNGMQRRDGCWAITAPADAYRWRVIRAEPAAELHTDGRPHVIFSTCEPRIERTPIQVESNPVEIVGR